MDTMEAIELLKKYNVYDDAKAECIRKKIDEAPYDMKGHHEIYNMYLSKVWVSLRDKKIELQKVRCKQWDNIPSDSRPLHEDCLFAGMQLKDSYCKTNCEYFKQIQKLEEDMKELVDARNYLKSAADYDKTWR